MEAWGITAFHSPEINNSEQAVIERNIISLLGT
jgi:hypothetical protein